MQFDITILPGDGIGPEVASEGVKVLESIAERFGHDFNFYYQLIGGLAIDKTGSALPQQTLDMCLESDAVLKGPLGGPKWDDPKAKVHPEDGLLALRSGLGLYANLRPVKVYPELINSTPIKPEILKGVDIVVVRELTGGLYFAKPKKQWTNSRGRHAVDTLAYSEREIERIIRVGFELARGRRKKLTSVDKANVLQSSRLWRQIANEVAADYPDVELDHMLVDACSMRLIQNPAYFDVMVTENMFGDILTDEASMLSGSMGMMPSASLAGIPAPGMSAFGMYEPIHGSAPDITGKGIANPISTILSVAMMLRYSFNLLAEAEVIELAVEDVLKKGYRCADIMEAGKKKVKTREMGDIIAETVRGK